MVRREHGRPIPDPLYCYFGAGRSGANDSGAELAGRAKKIGRFRVKVAVPPANIRSMGLVFGSKSPNFPQRFATDLIKQPFTRTLGLVSDRIIETNALSIRHKSGTL